jgi:hypothetical protein
LESLIYLGGRSIAQLKALASYATQCEKASYRYIRPKPQPIRYLVIGVLGRIQKAVGNDSTYLKPIYLVKEDPSNLRIQSDQSLITRVVDCERTERAAETDAESLYGKFVELRDKGILCDLELS